VKHFVCFLPKVLKSFFKKSYFSRGVLLAYNRPLVLALGVVLTAAYLPKIFPILLLALLITLAIPKIRELVKAWISNQFFLILAQFKALRGEVLMWKKGELVIVIPPVFYAFFGSTVKG